MTGLFKGKKIYHDGEFSSFDLAVKEYELPSYVKIDS